jgi:phage baseplate assembly protein W
MTDSASIIQQSGFDFPAVRQTPWGALSFIDNDTVALVKASIQQILLTNPGERPFNPSFGCPLRLMLFEPPTETLKESITTMIYEALIAWEPRIVLTPDDISLVASPTIATVTHVIVKYRLKSPTPSGQQSLTLSIGG